MNVVSVHYKDRSSTKLAMIACWVDIGSMVRSKPSMGVNKRYIR